MKVSADLCVLLPNPPRLTTPTPVKGCCELKVLRKLLNHVRSKDAVSKGDRCCGSDPPPLFFAPAVGCCIRAALGDWSLSPSPALPIEGIARALGLPWRLMAEAAVEPGREADPRSCYTVFAGSSQEDVASAKVFWSSLSLQPPLESRLVSGDIKQRLKVAPAAGCKACKGQCHCQTSQGDIKSKQLLIEAQMQLKADEKARYLEKAKKRKEILELIKKQKEKRIQRWFSHHMHDDVTIAGQGPRHAGGLSEEETPDGAIFPRLPRHVVLQVGPVRPEKNYWLFHTNQSK
ncbi:cilia- and flagella-associated protein HOATZ isoform X3 [Narcine bancroftii]|uniref:cilia- and flagella-associated protein HOATZ isoform X3 n=1 Tax=Narcine bancroftii TaxID=1343680 RepID=UPI003831695A